MTDFSNIQQKQPTTSARFTFYGIEGQPWVDVSQADESNKPYFNALLKSQLRNRRAFRAGRITADTVEQGRAEDRRLYAKHIVKGWGNLVDADGSHVEFSVESCGEFLSAIPYWMFDELRDFSSDPQSFVDQGTAEEDLDDSGKL